MYPLSGPVVHGAAVAAVPLAANAAKLKINDLALSLMSRILQVKVNEALSHVLLRPRTPGVSIFPLAEERSTSSERNL
jgi:hypothetical protein